MTNKTIEGLEKLISDTFANKPFSRESVMSLFDVIKKLPPQDLFDCALFSNDRPYGRKLLFHSPEGEVLIMGFLPGRECPPHDHDHADGLVLVCHGSARHRVFRRGENELQLVAETIENTYQVLDAPVDCVHSMGNASGSEPLVTLHVYWPPICQMALFDMENKQIHLVNDKAGAWLPVDPGTLIETRQIL